MKISNTQLTFRICFFLEMSDLIKINPRIWPWYETSEDTAEELSRITPPPGKFEEVKENIFSYVHKSDIGTLQLETYANRVVIIPVTLVKDNELPKVDTYGFVKMSCSVNSGKKTKRIHTHKLDGILLLNLFRKGYIPILLFDGLDFSKKQVPEILSNCFQKRTQKILHKSDLGLPMIAIYLPSLPDEEIEQLSKKNKELGMTVRKLLEKSFEKSSELETQTAKDSIQSNSSLKIRDLGEKEKINISGGLDCRGSPVYDKTILDQVGLSSQEYRIHCETE